MPHSSTTLLAASGAALVVILIARRRRRQPPAEPVGQKEPPANDKEAAAAAIQGWAACMRGKLRTVGKGHQPAEVLLVQKSGGVLRIDDCGGWSKRNESMERLFRSADASNPLPDFAPVLVQTTDRCFAQRANGELRLHLWQNQPLPAWLKGLIGGTVPLTRVLS